MSPEQRREKGRASKRKGKRGELEAASEWQRVTGVAMRRSVQFNGRATGGQSDIIGHDGVSIEVKRTEKLSIYAAMEQAKETATPGEIPIVLHRRNCKKWLAIVELDNLAELSKLIHERQVDAQVQVAEETEA